MRHWAEPTRGFGAVRAVAALVARERVAPYGDSSSGLGARCDVDRLHTQQLIIVTDGKV